MPSDSWGGVQRTYRPAEMGAEILGFNHVPDVRKWTVIVEENLPNYGVVLKDSWIANHYDDENLCLAIVGDCIRSQEGAASTYGGGILSSNKTITEKNPYKSTSLRYSGSNGAFISAGASEYQYAYCTADGSIIAEQPLFAGEYSVVAWLR